ncbi:hypothetical protein [Saliphagus sp. LR7]|uniref:hypothetical protein n=1 Tax=Saliphagus sp. LR7 TaxID=2282654 RepID=UPI000DF82D0E|nr:hypothetical protein [Saliphagus sp. LR7]
MYSVHHAIVSLIVGLAAVLVLPPVSLFGAAVPPAVLVLYAVAAGVLIDLDHFLIARLRTGGWDALETCLASPRIALSDQGEIFAPGDVGVLSRLLSHHLIGGLAVAALVLASRPLAVLTAVVLYAHVVSDLVWDVRGAATDDRPPAERLQTFR